MVKQMKAIFNQTVWRVMLCALWVVGAAAWAKPRVAVHPPEVAGGMDSERWNDQLMSEVAKQKVVVVPEALVEAFLQSHDGSCNDDMECLQNLGHATEASYVLEVRVYTVRVEDKLLAEKVLPKAYVASARIVQVDNGKVTKAVGPLEVAPVSETEEDNATAVYSKLLKALQLECLSGNCMERREFDPEVVVKSTSQSGWLPPPSQSTEPPPAPNKRLRIASYSLLGVSGAAASAGITFWGMSEANAEKFKKEYATEGKPRTVREGVDVDAAQKLANTISRQRTYGLILGSIAGAAAIASLMLYFMDGKFMDGKSIGLVPTPGGALLSFQGRFP